VRFGRIILVTLAPLLGLSAISAAIATGPAVSNEHKSNSLTRFLLLSVVAFAPSCFAVGGAGRDFLQTFGLDGREPNRTSLLCPIPASLPTSLLNPAILQPARNLR
jgi:hypothetical protein